MKAQEKAAQPDVAYFSSLEEAERHMAETAGCEVRQCVYPTVGNLAYYISLNADVFGVRHLKQGKHARMWSVTKNKTCPYYKKRVYYRLSKGHHYGP